MKGKLLFLVLIIVSAWKVYGQHDNYSAGNNIDSVRINYMSLGEFLDVNMMLKKDVVLFVSNWGDRGMPIYQTNNYDTIDYLFNYINIIADNPPIIDSSMVANDCCDGMTIYIYKDNNVCEKTYIHYSEAYFPFAYTELYSLIRQILAKYWKRE